MIGKDAYRVAQTLCSPKSPSDYTYTELVGILKKHYTPVKLQIAESFKFRRCAQNDNESISEFVSRLRKCASICNYETFLERALKEQFTVGLRNKETQLKLLSKEHSPEESIQQAIADEAAFRESAIIVPSSGGTNVNYVKRFPPKKTQVTTNQHSKNFRSKAKSAAKPVSASSNTATGASTYKCYSCGQSDHKRSACRFREVVCNKCSQKGHIAKVCISAKAVHSLEEVNEELYHITSDATEGLFVNMDVEGRNVKFQIDTGFGVSIVPMSVYKLFSAYGCGGVLFHRIDNNDRPVAFASCSLSKCQKNYSQLDKEAFSIIFCLKRFHQFLYGRSFHIITDHKPLLQLLGEHKPVPVHTAARLQRYSLILASYNYKLEFRSTKFHVDADCMSRIPMTTTFDPPLVNLNCNFFSTVTNINQNAVKRLTQRHPLLSKVYRYTLDGLIQPILHSLHSVLVKMNCLLKMAVSCGVSV